MPIWEIYELDCRLALAMMLGENSVDSIVTDPPYELTSKRPGGRSPATKGKVMKGFMGMEWDGSGVAFDPTMWAEAYRVLKPGGYLLAFSGARTYHRMVCAIEDAGFEIRDQIMWIFGSGFPKSHNLDGDRSGWGTALKPAHEPIVVARKPLIGTVATNTQIYGTGAINIDACRVEAEKATGWGGAPAGGNTWSDENCGLTQRQEARPVLGRWPANVIHDGSVEVVGGFPMTKSNSGNLTHKSGARGVAFGKYGACPTSGISDQGSAARFFYCAKASKSDRDEGLEDAEAKTNAAHRRTNLEESADSPYLRGLRYGAIPTRPSNPTILCDT